MSVRSTDPEPADKDYWARVGPRLTVSDLSHRTQAKMVDGRLVAGPIQGFGQMWQKSYRVSLGSEVSPSEVIAIWKEHFSEFWPKGNRFYAPLTGIAPGEVALLDVSLAPGAGLSTGVLVLYADDESFTLMTPQGHVFAGWITFSASTEEGNTVARALVLMRAADPICELGLTFGGHRREDSFWEQTLASLARHLGIEEPAVERQVVCIDTKRQWSRAGNVWQNGAIRTGMYRGSAPLRWAFGLPRRARRQTKRD
jgi:hypothetical protein